MIPSWFSSKNMLFESVRNSSVFHGSVEEKFLDLCVCVWFYHVCCGVQWISILWECWSFRWYSHISRDWFSIQLYSFRISQTIVSFEFCSIVSISLMTLIGGTPYIYTMLHSFYLWSSIFHNCIYFVHVYMSMLYVPYSHSFKKKTAMLQTSTNSPTLRDPHFTADSPGESACTWWYSSIYTGWRQLSWAVWVDDGMWLCWWQGKWATTEKGLDLT